MAERVTLVSPDGNETVVSDPAAKNNLIFGAGYKPKTVTGEVATAAPASEPGGVRATDTTADGTDTATTTGRKPGAKPAAPR